MVTMLRYFLVLACCCYSLNSFANGNSAERAELIHLLEGRAAQFREYTGSLQQKSGIFGQRTKTDLKGSHDRLAAIVETDNEIIRLLDRMLDQRTFERVSMTYDASRDADRIRNLQAVSDTMTARAARYEAELTKYKSGRSGRSAWLWFFALLALAEGAIILRLRKSSGRRFT